MDYIRKIEKNNVGLKTTLKNIFKDIDTRITNVEENSTTPEEEQSPSIISFTVSIDIKNFEINQLQGALVDDTLLSGGGLKLVCSTTNAQILSQQTYFNQIVSKIKLNKVTVNNVETPITNGSFSYDSNYNINWNGSVKFPTEEVDGAIKPIIPASDVNTITVEIENLETGYVFVTTRKFNKQFGWVND